MTGGATDGARAISGAAIGPITTVGPPTADGSQRRYRSQIAAPATVRPGIDCASCAITFVLLRLRGRRPNSRAGPPHVRAPRGGWRPLSLLAAVPAPCSFLTVSISVVTMASVTLEPLATGGTPRSQRSLLLGEFKILFVKFLEQQGYVSSKVENILDAAVSKANSRDSSFCSSACNNGKRSTSAISSDNDRGGARRRRRRRPPTASRLKGPRKQKSNIPFYTFAFKEERKVKAVIKGIPLDFETVDIKDDPISNSCGAQNAPQKRNRPSRPAPSPPVPSRCELLEEALSWVNQQANSETNNRKSPIYPQRRFGTAASALGEDINTIMPILN
ncbi:hypothetical protein EVAR_16503_1 [Eumeta japonica]|uniref:Uncharacterized protein n=1 Tax=Eumeta variegata TaxID=151549 RepID=A0A4C1UKE0_EUMVA|nr:hypothetical protein EVAR_16503_1 [Eumeta japonica]